LFDAMSERLGEEKSSRQLHLPFAQGRKRAWLHAQGVVTAEEADETGHQISVLWTPRQEKRFRDL
jgi:GTPase